MLMTHILLQSRSYCKKETLCSINWRKKHLERAKIHMKKQV